jgi:hypothetical protein
MYPSTDCYGTSVGRTRRISRGLCNQTGLGYDHFEERFNEKLIVIIAGEDKLKKKQKVYLAFLYQKVHHPGCPLYDAIAPA